MVYKLRVNYQCQLSLTDNGNGIDTITIVASEVYRLYICVYIKVMFEVNCNRMGYVMIGESVDNMIS